MINFRINLLSIAMFLGIALSAQDKPAYELFNHKGKKVDYADMVKDLAKSDMVFFGEYHTDPIAHWLQFEITNDLFKSRSTDLFLGAEMFESGNQLVIDEYLAGFYPEDKMLDEITQLWKNYKTDYKPLLDFAKNNNLRFIASNIPRRYASMINKKGLESINDLSDQAKQLISPDIEKYFDPTVKAYAEMSKSMGGHVPKNMLNIQAAQAAKDATMAYFILKNFNEGNILIHFQGSYHSNYNQGIIWWINKSKPGFKIKSIATLYKKEWNELSDQDKSEIANYIVVVADNMTNTGR